MKQPISDIAAPYDDSWKRSRPHAEVERTIRHLPDNGMTFFEMLIENERQQNLLFGPLRRKGD